MVIDFDTSVLPRGVVGLRALLDAIAGAHKNDENQWIEFKANVDPATKEGRATVAKAIVAFANRDPLTAEKWFGGHGVIVIGLEPGNLVGAREIDPAELHDKVSALIAAPAPKWDATPVTYEGKHVLVITVDPPRQGDPIAVIGSSSGEVEDGHVYVRKLGKSDRAKAADIRRLSARLHSTQSISGVTVSPAEGSEVPVLTYPKSWLDDWLYTEERRLLAPLDPPPPTRPMTASERRSLGLTDRAMADIFKSTEQARKAMAAIGGGITHQESRSEEEFREEVGVYLDECRTGLKEAFENLRNTATLAVSLEITNHTESNYEQVLVELHVEGDVFGYEDEGRFTEITDYLPRAPREWGPWTEDPFRFIQPHRSYTLASEIGAAGVGPSLPAGPRPTIINGGSVNVTCPPVHLYPRRTEHLLGIWLVGDGPLGDEVRVTWTATASNVDGTVEGEFTIPVLQDAWDVSEHLEHSDDR